MNYIHTENNNRKIAVQVKSLAYIGELDLAPASDITFEDSGYDVETIHRFLTTHPVFAANVTTLTVNDYKYTKPETLLNDISGIARSCPRIQALTIRDDRHRVLDTLTCVGDLFANIRILTCGEINYEDRKGGTEFAVRNVARYMHKQTD